MGQRRLVGVLAMSTRSSGGFSLIEVLVAISLIGFISLAVVPMFVLGSRSNLAAAQIGTCSALAMERMERLRVAKMATLVAGGSLTTSMTGYSDTANGGFAVRWRISGLTDPAGGKQIEVRAISLRAALGPDKQVTFVTTRVP